MKKVRKDDPPSAIPGLRMTVDYTLIFDPGDSQRLEQCQKSTLFQVSGGQDYKNDVGVTTTFTNIGLVQDLKPAPPAPTGTVYPQAASVLVLPQTLIQVGPLNNELSNNYTFYCAFWEVAHFSFVSSAHVQVSFNDDNLIDVYLFGGTFSPLTAQPKRERIVDTTVGPAFYPDGWRYHFMYLPGGSYKAHVRGKKK